MARCPECNARVSLPEGVGQWSHLFCESCGTKLEILNLDPLELETVYDDDDEDVLYELEDDEDGDDDDDDDEDWQ